MQTHPDADLRPVRPRIDSETSLGLDSSSDGWRSGWKDREEGIALGADFDATVPSEDITNQLVVCHEDGVESVGELVPEPRRAFDVGEKNVTVPVGRSSRIVVADRVPAFAIIALTSIPPRAKAPVAARDPVTSRVQDLCRTTGSRASSSDNADANRNTLCYVRHLLAGDW